MDYTDPAYQLQWAADAANEADIDPVFFQAIMEIELGNKLSRAVRRVSSTWQAGTRRAATVRRHRLVEYAGKAFNLTKAAPPDEFKDVQSSDLSDNPAIAHKAAAFHLRNLQDQVRSAPKQLRSAYTLQEVTAAAYNINMVDLQHGDIQDGMSYMYAVDANHAQANQLICQSGIWTC